MAGGFDGARHSNSQKKTLQVDRDLFILRNLTEKSELWVQGGGHAGSSSSSSTEKEDQSSK